MSLVVLLALSAHADWPPGETLDPAVSLDVTEEGLDAVLDVVPALLPEKLTLDPMYDEGSMYRYSITNMWVGLALADGDLDPDLDVLHLDLTVDVWINSDTDPFQVDVDAYTLWWWDLATCDVYSDTFHVTARGDVTLRIDDTVDPAVLDAEITLTQDLDIGLEGDDIHLDCWVGTLDDILDVVGLSPVDAAVDYAKGEIQGQVDGMLDELEVTLEDTFNQATLEEVVDLNGVPLTIALQPSDVRIRPAGVRVAMSGSFDAPASACVDEYGYTQSHATPGVPPDIGGSPSEIPDGHHVGVFIDDDFANQAMFAAWRGGILCQDLSEDDGLPLNSALLSALSPDYAELFPETVPLQLITRPSQPPLVRADGPSDVNLDVRGLGVDFMGDLAFRRAKILGAELQVDAGAHLQLDKTPGMLDIAVDLSGEDITTEIVHNELLPGQDDELADAFTGLFDSLVGPLLGPALEGLAFALPSMEGVGLTSLAVAPSGPDRDHIGAFATVGPVEYEGSGCNGDGGDEGCGGGCSHGTPGGLLLILTGMGAVLRRRRR